MLGNIFTTHNSLDSSFHTGEVLILVLLQGIRLGNGFINLCIISILVLQSCNCIFNCFRHCIYFALLRNIFTTNNSIDSSFHTRKIFVLILIQGICLGNRFVNLSVISILILQGCNCIFNSFRHCVNFRLFGNVLITNDSLHSGFHNGEIFVLILVQGICLGNRCIYLCIIGR